MFNVYSFVIRSKADGGRGLALVAASSPEEAVELLGWSDWEHPDNADKTTKLLVGVKADSKGVLESYFTYD